MPNFRPAAPYVPLHSLNNSPARFAFSLHLMRRQQGKIKDFVELQPHDFVPDIAADPARALAAYRFTDATSDLLARWLDALAEVPRHATHVSSSNANVSSANMMRALAGARGVGKSHTLEAFAAIAAAPELRARLTDAHVATSARRLSGRRYVVAHIERGSAPTLIEEVAAGLARACGGDAEEYLAQSQGDVQALLVVAASRLYDATLVIVVDTAFGRANRVERDDGKLLAELAHAAHAAHAFIGLALDDDITNAEGVNVAIARTFRIDYLDPEHLFRVADTYVLRKTPNARTALHDFYLGLRAEVQGFNWSEPRFTALYPLHPLVADIASAVRLYAPAFALLPFAAQAAGRATARPPLALVTLDDVFDYAEAELRRARALEKTFLAYAELCQTSINKLPVMARLEARLILKALFIMSLDGRGATAVEICAAMLFEDVGAMGTPPGTTANTARVRVALVLERFYEDAPHGTFDRSQDAHEPRYRLHVETTSGFDAQLKAAMQTIESDHRAMSGLLHAAAQSRFSDWTFGTINSLVLAAPDDTSHTAIATFIESNTATDGEATYETSDEISDEAMTAYLTWRGTQREGLIMWRDETASSSSSNQESNGETSHNDRHVEWRVTVCAPPRGQTEAGNRQASTASPVNEFSHAHLPKNQSPVMLDVVWRPAMLTNDERQILSRLVTLQRTPELFAAYGDTAHAALATAHAQVERIWSRIYLDESTLATVASHTAFTEQKWSDEAKSALTLAEALSRTFARCFDELYQEHPTFVELLDDLNVNRLVRDFFGGANTADVVVQKLAATFAAPLGLTVQRGTSLTATTGDELLCLRWARDIIQMSDAAEGAIVSLAQVAAVLERPPFGFGQNVQRLVLAALVASRRLEFVTHGDDRISRRTLSSSIKWDLISGVARPAAIIQSAGELTAWARLLTKGTANETIPDAPDEATTGESISDSATRENVRERLSAWLAAWRENNLLARFAELPDEALTTRAADLANIVERSFEASAEAIDHALAEDISLEEGLQRVADAFVNSTEKFAKCQTQLAQLSRYVEHFQRREKAHLYLLAAEQTGISDIDDTRQALLEITSDPHSLFDEHTQTRFEMLWREFHTAYIERFAARHDAVMNGAARRELGDELVRAATFRELEALAELSLIDRSHWQNIERVRERVRAAHCVVDVRQILQTSARCVCGFRLSSEHRFAGLTSELSSSIEIGRATARRTLGDAAPFVAFALEQFARASTNSVAEHATRLSEDFKHPNAPHGLSRREVQLIEQALAACLSPPAVRVMLPIENHELLTPEELHARLTQWLKELPTRIAVVEVTHRTD
ncbi:MAG: hypothetical protein MSG64_18170 [Pyrinomonadaceae bacterium MAG19_C2-C3]|nr:hypothetical protein [Pyrinomonadaceae bacterium MAG19_C2-C3]